MVDYDIIFISETHSNGQLLKKVEGYHIIADPSFLSKTHGGMAAYVKSRLYCYISDIRFTKCTLSFSISTLPGFCFMLVYIYPYDSYNFEIGDFGILSEELSYWVNKGFIPYIGGDFNSRLGDINTLSQKILKWRFQENVDVITNSHGRQLISICELHNILPLNHCLYYSKTWQGKFTYYKAGNSSQIDFILTNRHGRKFVTDFNIVETGWHLSDHLPLVLKLQLPFQISADMLLARSLELPEGYLPLNQLSSYRFKFNIIPATQKLQDNFDMIMESCNTNSPDLIIETLEKFITPILKENKIKNNHIMRNTISDDVYVECDTLFDVYVEKSRDESADNAEVQEAYENYQSARNALNAEVFQYHEEKYKNILNSNDTRKLWSEINWSGGHKTSAEHRIPIRVMSDYFEHLFQPLDINESKQLEDMHTDTDLYIPVTDDPITEVEISNAYKKMKKGGYDFSLDVLKMIMVVLLPIMLILVNLVFFVSYPMKFAMSLLSAIPKKGNLKILSNYRGIHMQNLLSLLYDRVIANRLIMWARIHPEQSAFQKGKSTLNHIFLLRTVIATCKRANMTLFLGFFDLEKAFDKVSRPLLLASLIKLGIGSTMFYAIKAMYSTTRCIVKAGHKLSDIFITHSGIKQGAPSSVILFVIFMDEFIDIMRDKCIRENVIGMLHILLHADDTAVLSTSKELFLQKCNTLLAAFKQKKVSLNLKKSGFLVINPKNAEDRYDLKLENGWLSYNASFVYLGAVFSDTGAVYHDVNQHACQREKSVYVKLANFMRNNPAAPITVKRKILNSCLNASLLYGAETWGGVALRSVETLYRKAIKITFRMNRNTPNEIVFLETGLSYLQAEIYKRQYTFWEKIIENIEDDPHSEISLFFKLALEKNIHYLRHYQKLHQNFENAKECFQFYATNFQSKCKEDVSKKAAEHPNGILQTYVYLNSTLSSPEYYHKYMLGEKDRQIMTKYRCGSHFLKITTGRYTRTPVEKRLCKCKEVQTLQHVIFQCALTAPLRDEQFPTTLENFFKDPVFAAAKLRLMECILKIRKF